MIELKSITHLFQPKRGHGVSNINLKLQPGEVVALMGSNGSGKTTLLNIISETITAQAGSLIKTSAFQKSFFLTLNQLNQETADIPQNLIEEKRSFAQWMNLTQVWDTATENLSTGTAKKWAQLSSFLNLEETSLLLLDEPFAHLDATSVASIMEKLKEWAVEHQRCILWATHQLTDAARWSHRMIFLQQGKILFDGLPFDFLYHPPTTDLAKEVPGGNLLLGHYSEGQLKTADGNLNLKTILAQLQDQQLQILNQSTPERPCCMWIKADQFMLSFPNYDPPLKSKESETFEVQIKDLVFEYLRPILVLTTLKSQRLIKIEIPIHQWKQFSYPDAIKGPLLLSLKENATIHLFAEF